MIVGTKVASVNSCIANGDGTVDLKGTKTMFGDFSFTKTKADGTTALQGAEFVIKNGEKYGKYDETTKAWSWVDTQADGTTFTSGTDGKVTFHSLPADTYTVVETKVPDGYLQDYKPSFTLTVKYENGKPSFTVSTTNDQDQWDLVTGEGTADVKVKNVQNITELPKTGAAGTIMFSVVAVLIAGAAVTVYLRSRATKRQLMA